MRLKISLFLAITLILIAILAPIIFTYDPTLGNLDDKFLPP